MNAQIIPFTLALSNGANVKVRGTRQQVDKVKSMVRDNDSEWVTLTLATEDSVRFTCPPSSIIGIYYLCQ